MGKKHMYWGWVFISHYVLGLMIFFVAPVIFSIFISFTRYDMFNPPKIIGFQNWIATIQNPNLWKAVRNVFLYGIVLVPIQTFLACILAVALNQKLKYMKVFRVAFFIPVITPWVAVSLIWNYLYNPQYGILNYLLSFTGLGPFEYTGSSKWWMVVISIAAVTIWKGVGYVTVIMLAGLQNISADVMEAAVIDGAGVLKRFLKITLPLLSPTIFMVLILGTMSSFQVFDPFFVMLNSQGSGTIGYDKSVINVLIYENAFVYNKMYIASTIAWITFVFIAIITFIQNRMEKRWVHYE